jgi:hypothetical protein
VIAPIPRPLAVCNVGFLIDTSLWFFLIKMEFEVNDQLFHFWSKLFPLR